MLYEEGTRREHIMLKLTESHPNNIFLYKDAHILTFSHKMTFSCTCMLCLPTYLPTLSYK